MQTLARNSSVEPHTRIRALSVSKKCERSKGEVFFGSEQILYVLRSYWNSFASPSYEFGFPRDLQVLPAIENCITGIAVYSLCHNT